MYEVVKSLKDFKKHLLTGVSYMIPVIVAGGVLFSLAVVIGGQSATPTDRFRRRPGKTRYRGLDIVYPHYGRLYSVFNGRPTRNRSRHYRCLYR